MPDFAGMDAVSEDSDENNFDDSNHEKMKYSKFTFSGMSFKDYVNSLEANLNEEMKKIVSAYIEQKVIRHPSIHLNQRKIQLKHPIFRLLTINALKYVIDCAYILKLKPGQTAYRQGIKAANNVYFVLYGTFDYKVWEEKAEDTDTSNTEAPERVISPDGTKI